MIHAVNGARTWIERSSASCLDRTVLPDRNGRPLIYVGLGERDLAVNWLQKAFADRSLPLLYFRNKDWDSLHSDPRYIELTNRIGFPP